MENTAGNITNSFSKLLQFTYQNTISNALLFCTNLSHICARIQALSKLKLMYLPIIKALR